MQSEPTDGLEALTRRVAKLERVIQALANRVAGEDAVRNVLLDLVEPPRSREATDGLMNNQEACAYLAMASSTWRNFRAKHGIHPVTRVGRSPRYRRRDLDDVIARLGGGP